MSTLDEVKTKRQEKLQQIISKRVVEIERIMGRHLSQIEEQGVKTRIEMKYRDKDFFSEGIAKTLLANLDNKNIQETALKYLVAGIQRSHSKKSLGATYYDIERRVTKKELK